MDETIKRSFWSRLSALGFIFLIVVGNIWYAKMIVGEPIGVWIQLSFYLSVGMALVGAVGVTYLLLRQKLVRSDKSDPENPEDPE